MKKTIAKINETESWLFEKINKTDKPLAKFIKKKRENTQINKIRNERNYNWHHRNTRIIRDYYKQLYAKKTEQPGRNGQILRKEQPSKTEPGRNIKYEKTNHK